MILRITVDDNDFTEELENFAQALDLYPYIHDYVKNLPTDEALTFFSQNERFRELFYNTDKYTPELASELCDLGRYNWELWVNYCLNKRTWQDDTEFTRIKSYLIKNFKVKFQRSLTPKWENGEAVYICCGYYNRWWTF